MIRHAITGAVGVVVLGAALAMAQAADPPRPTQLTKTGVAGWSQAAGIEPGRFEFLGATRDGVFYTDPSVRVIGGNAHIDMRFERFEPKPGGRGGMIRSERAIVEVDCPRMVAKVGNVNGYADHNLKGRDQESDKAAWTLIGGAEDWGRVARGNLLFPGRVDMCRAANAAREQNREAAARNKARDARDARDARTRGLPGRPGPVNRRY